MRESNEDAWLAIPEIGMFAVIDGMGGARAGARAASLTREAFTLARPASTPDLRGAFEAAHKAIRNHADKHPEDAGLGCVATAALLRGSRLTLAHVGDTRAYLASKAGCQQLTRDHTVVAEIQERHAMTEADAGALPGKHRVTRDLGSGARHEGAVWVDLADGEIDVHDVLLLASDGLTDLVDDGEIARRLGRAREDADSSLERLAERFVELSLERGGHDNITVVLVRCCQIESLEDTETIAVPVPVRRDRMVKVAREATTSQRFGVGPWLGGIAIGVAIGLAASTLLPRLSGRGATPDLLTLVEGSDPAVPIDLRQLGGRFETSRSVTALGPLAVPDGALLTEVGAHARLELRGLDIRFPESPATWTLRLEAGATLVLSQASIRAEQLDLIFELGAGARVLLRDSHLALRALRATGAADAAIVRSGGRLLIAGGAPAIEGPTWNEGDTIAEPWTRDDGTVDDGTVDDGTVDGVPDSAAGNPSSAPDRPVAQGTADREPQ